MPIPSPVITPAVKAAREVVAADWADLEAEQTNNANLHAAADQALIDWQTAQQKMQDLRMAYALADNAAYSSDFALQGIQGKLKADTDHLTALTSPAKPLLT